MTGPYSRSTRGERIFYRCNYVLLTLFCCTIVLPFLNILALSFNEGVDASLGGITFWPRIWSLENYRYVFNDIKFLKAYRVTIARTVAGTIISVLLTAMASFALKSPSLPGRRLINKYVVFTMLFSGGAIPTFITLQRLHLINTFWVFIFNSSLVAAWDVMVMRTFFEGISTSLEESAKLDGCSDLGVFFRIVLPISKPVVSVIALFKAVYHWNDWFSGAYYIKTQDLIPVQTMLQRMLQREKALEGMVMNAGVEALAARTVTGESLKMATIIVSVLPIICVYPFIQKYFVKGVMLGSVKE